MLSSLLVFPARAGMSPLPAKPTGAAEQCSPRERG